MAYWAANGGEDGPDPSCDADAHRFGGDDPGISLRCAMRRLLFGLYRAGLPRYNALLDTGVRRARSPYRAARDRGRRGRACGEWWGSPPARALAHNGMSRCFTGLLGAMDRFNSAQTRCSSARWRGETSGRGPSGSRWQRSEAALTAMLEALHEVMAAELNRCEDRALWEMGIRPVQPDRAGR